MGLAVNGEFLVILIAEISFPVKYIAIQCIFYRSRLSLLGMPKFNFQFENHKAPSLFL